MNGFDEYSAAAIFGGQKIPILDHGYVQFIEHWGADWRIIEAARMSTDKGFQGWGTPEAPGDEKLLRFLYQHKHATPFEMAGAIFEIQAPIFVFREWHRHRTQSYNEMSARYTPLPNLNYMPTPERCLVVSSTNKQAGAVAGADPLTHEAVLDWLEDLEHAYNKCQAVYEKGLAIGIPKEIARLPVPVARYSRMRASANLRNWLAFMTLRDASTAQEEIQIPARVVGQILQLAFPRTMALWTEFDQKR